jgi:hypothetical protein
VIPTARNVRLVACCAVWIGLSACDEGRVKEPAGEQRPTSHFIILVDRSGSRTPQQMEELRLALRGVLDIVEYGDKVSVLQVMEAGLDRVVEYADSIPLPLNNPPNRREVMIHNAVRETLQSVAQKFSDPAGTEAIRSTDLLQSFRRVGEYMKFSQGRVSKIIVFSDMIQSVPGMYFGNPSKIPDENWIAARAKDGLMPSLAGACVWAIGADAGDLRANKIEMFWRQYLSKAGARVPGNFFNRLLPVNSLNC